MEKVATEIREILGLKYYCINYRVKIVIVYDFFFHMHAITHCVLKILCVQFS